MASFEFTSGKRIPLTATEVSYLEDIVASGDRAGFYLAYYAMTGNTEALLTARISTFSESVGGIAFAANWLLQDDYRNGGAVGSGPYTGIYKLSQEVALRSLEAIKYDLSGEILDDRSNDTERDGLVKQNRLFVSSFDAWIDQQNKTLFPGNFLIGNPVSFVAGDFTVPDWSAGDAQLTEGYKYSIKALLYANYFGKRQADGAGTVIEGPDGIKIAIGPDGRVSGVFDGPTGVLGLLTSLSVAAAQVASGWMAVPPEDRANPGTWIENFIAASGLLVGFPIQLVQSFKAIWAEELPNFELNLRQMANVAPDTPIDQINFSTVRAGFSEFSGGYTGDVNPNTPNEGFSDPLSSWSQAGTSENDILYLSGGSSSSPKNAEAGDDLVFGSIDADAIDGGAGNDIIWGKDGRDHVTGGSGNDLIRGGQGNDTLIGGAGDDTLSGGDLLSTPILAGGQTVDGYTLYRDGTDVADYRNAPGKVVINFNEQDQVDLDNHTFIVKQDGDGGRDILHSIERVRLTSGKDEVVNTERGNELGIRFWFSTGDNTLDLKMGDASGIPVAQTGSGSIYEFATKNDDGTSVVGEQIQTIRVEGGYDKNSANASWLYVDGKQLVGGAAFDFDMYDRYSGHPFEEYGAVTSGFSEKFGIADIRNLSTTDRINAWLGEYISAGMRWVGALNDAGSGAPGVPAGSPLPLFGVVGGALLAVELVRLKDAWNTLYRQDIIGTQGERYILDNATYDANGRVISADLTIQMKPESDGAPDYTIVVDGWRQGDFGIRIENLAWKKGLDSGKNKNAEIDSWRTIDLADVQEKLRTVGFEAGGIEPFDETGEGSSSGGGGGGGGGGGDGGSGDAPPGSTRQGNELGNRLAGTGGSDTFLGAQGDDVLVGDEGRDIYVFAAGDGHDVISDLSLEGNIVRFLNGLDVSTITRELVEGEGGLQDLLVTYGLGNTIRIVGWSSLSTEVQDLWTFESANAAITKESSQTPDLSVLPESEGGTAKLEINGTSASETISGRDLDERIDALAGDDTVYAGSGNDLVLGGNGNDTLYGEIGDDDLQGGAGNDWISGGYGADRISGGSGNDTLIGGRGNDVFTLPNGSDGQGSDTYIFNRGDGRDQIDTTFARPTLKFGEGIDPDDIIFVRIDGANPFARGNLFVQIAGSDDQIQFINKRVTYTGNNDADTQGQSTIGPERIEFANGAIWTKAEIFQRYLATAGTANADIIYGTASADTIQGGAGDDLLDGLKGADTYIWNRGDGNDTIVDTDDYLFTPATAFNRPENRLKFGAGISPEDVSFRLNPGAPIFGQEVSIIIAGVGGGTISVSGLTRVGVLDKIIFADGTIWNGEAIQARLNQDLVSSGNDLIEASRYNDVISTGDGNDIVLGSYTADYEDGARDVINGGRGNDLYRNSKGTYVFDADFGQDEIDALSNAGTIIKFSTYNLGDFSTSYTIDEISSYGKLTLSRNGASDSLTFNEANQFEFQFADGVVLRTEQLLAFAQRTAATTTLITDTSASETITGGATADHIIASFGSDTIFAGAGDDVVTGGDGGDVINGQDGDDLLVGGQGSNTIHGGTGADVVVGGGSVDVLAGGTGNDLLYGGGGADQLDGGIDQDQLRGGAGADNLAGGLGDDILIGEAGSDTYVFYAGDGHDVIRAGESRGAGEIETLQIGGGIAAEDLLLSFNGQDLVIGFALNPNDQITLADFAGRGAISSVVVGSTALSLTDLLVLATGATAGNDTTSGISSGTGQRVIFGGRGSDQLNGNTSADSYIFNAGDGSDIIFERDFTGSEILAGIGNDQLMLGGGILPENLRMARGTQAADLILTFTNSSDRIEIKKQFGTATGNGVESIKFEDGTVWNKSDIRAQFLARAATSGADTIVGFDGHDRLLGGSGNDTLSGGAGNDIYFFNSGDGVDTITDDIGTEDKVLLGAGISETSVSVRKSATDANDIILSLGAGNELILKSVFMPTAAGIEFVEFASGVIWNRRDLVDRALEATATSSADSINGTAANDRLSGKGGNDTLAGGAGDDTYVFGRGDGQDTIVELASAGHDKLVFSSGIDAQSTTIRRDSVNTNNLILDVGQGELVTVKDFFLSGSPGIEQVEFADGTIWGRTQIEQKLLAALPTNGADTITGTIGADDITGGAGDDTINGGGGSDRYVFNRGDGRDTIQDSGSQPDQLRFGPGITAADIDLFRAANDLIITIRGTTDQITIKNQFLNATAKLGEITFADGLFWGASEIARLADNRAPTVGSALQSQTATEDSLFSFTVPTDSFVDLDAGDGLILSAQLADGSPLPAWLRFDGHTFTGTPANGDVGTIAVRIVAMDQAGDRVSQDLTLNILNLNDAPRATQAVANQAAPIGSLFTFQLPSALFVDPDTGSTVTLSATLSDGSPLPSWLSFDNATGTFTGTPAPASAGAISVVVNGSDGSLVGTTSFGIYVGNAPNSAPTVGASIAPLIATEDQPFSYQVPASAFTDNTPGDQLRYTATLADGAPLPAWLALDPVAGIFSGKPGNADVGALQVRLTATDISGGAASLLLDLNVANVNDAPVVTTALPAFLISEDYSFSYTVPTNTFADSDLGDVLTLTATLADGSPLPTWLEFDQGQRRFVGIPDQHDVGTLDIVVTARDSAGVTVSSTMTLLIQPTNDAPVVVNPIEDISVEAGVHRYHFLPAAQFSDIDSGQLTISATQADGSPLPTWIWFNEEYQLFEIQPDKSLIPPGEGAKVFEFHVVSTDGDGRSTSDVFQVRVTAFEGTSGDDQIYGTTGSETLLGQAGNDVIDGKGGSDIVDGGDGVDLVRYDGLWRDYRIEYDEFNDRYFISDRRVSWPEEDYDVVKNVERFEFTDGVRASSEIINRYPIEILIDAYAIPENSSPGAILARLSAVDDIGDSQLFVLEFGGDDKFEIVGNTIRLKAGASLDYETKNSYQLDISFYDSQGQWLFKTHVFQISAAVGVITGTAGSDTLSGTAQANRILGLAGQDLLQGLAGADTLEGGADNDTLEGGIGNDHLLGGVGDDVLIGGAGADLLDGGEGIDRADYSSSVAAVTLDLSSEGSGAGDAQGDIATNVEEFSLTDHDDHFVGSAAAETVYGGAGNDMLHGGAGDDRLFGEQGDDTLVGGLGHDTYVFSPGGGIDAINGFVAGAATADVIDFDRAMFGDFAAVMAAATQVGSDTVITIDANNRLTLKSVSMSNLSADDFIFHGVAPGPNVIHASPEGGYLLGSDGDDRFVGGAGDDVFFGGWGNDIYEGAGGTNQVDFSGAAADYSFTRNSDGSITVVSAYGTSMLTNIDGFWFYGEGQWYAADQLAPVGGVNMVYATPEGGYLIGSDDDDHFVGGSGDDIFFGGWGDDIYDGAGGYNQVDFQDAASDYNFTRNADGTVTVVSSYGTSTLKDIDGVFFYGESQWYSLDALAPPPSVTLTGTGGDDNLTGDGGDDVLNGLGGNDDLYGGSGDDVLNGGAGHDLLVGQDGNDTLNGDVDDSDVGNDTLAAGGGNDTLNGFAGSDRLYGEAGNDIVLAGAGDDSISGNEGDDELTGGSGNDVFVFASGFGKDTIVDFLAGSGTDDLIEFDDAVFADLSAVLAASSQVGADTVISYDIDNTITLKNVTKTSLHTDDFRFV